MISRNYSRFVFFFRHLYSISLKLSCFIPSAPFPLFYHIFYHFGELNQRFLKGNDRPLSAKTVLEHHRLISTVLDQAEKEGLVPFNVARKAMLPKAHQKEVNYFQPEQIAAIRDALELEPVKWRTLVHMLLITGARRGEILGLKWVMSLSWE